MASYFDSAESVNVLSKGELRVPAGPSTADRIALRLLEYGSFLGERFDTESSAPSKAIRTKHGGMMTQQFKQGYALLIAVDENKVSCAALPDVGKDVAALREVLVHPDRCAYPSENFRLLSGPKSTQTVSKRSRLAERETQA